jgi:cytochrome bd-type quinol oxidase subunit 2
MMEQTRIKLSALWVCLMLTYLLGDVLRIFSGDFSAGEVIGMEISPALMLAMAVLMVIPVVMVLLTLVLKQAVNRWANIILSIFFFVFNAIGLPTYPSLYDQFLIVVGLVFNLVIVWISWKWREEES